MWCYMRTTKKLLLTFVCGLVALPIYVLGADILRPPNTILVANEAATGTTVNKLVKLRKSVV